MSISQDEPIKAVLDFLRSHEYYKAFIALEQESGVRYHTYGKEIDFLYDLIMEGRFEDSEKFIAPLRSRSEFNYTKVLFEIRKQKFLEALENSESPNLQELVIALKEIESLSNKEEFNTLCYCLSLNKITDHPDYSNWDIWRGRQKCFSQCISFFSLIFPTNPFTKLSYTIEELISNREDKPQSPNLKESSRYSLSQQMKPSDSSYIINESEAERESAMKKSVSWNMESKEDADPDEESKKIFVEAIDVAVDTPHENLSEVSEKCMQTNYELMNQFDPSFLREISQVKDIQPIRACCFNSDGDYFVLGTNSKSLKICSLHNIVDGLIYNEQQGREQYIDIVFELHGVHIGSVYCVDWSYSGNFIASGSNDKSIKLLKCPDFLTLQENNSETVIYSNGKYLNGEGELPKINERVLTGHDGTVRAVMFNPADDKFLYSGGLGDACLKVWSTETGQCIQNFHEHKGAIYSIASSGDGQVISTVGTDRKIRLWDLKSSKCSFSMNAESFSDMNSVSINFSAQNIRSQTHSKIAALYSNKVSSSSVFQKLISVGHNDGVVSLWDLTAGKLFSKYTYHTQECRSVEFSSNSAWVASGSFDSTLGLVDTTKGQVFKFEPHMDKIVSVRWHPSLPILLSTSADKTARIFSI
jgi:WD repeat-containing protein 47